jgi:uncharacterized membrane protein
MPFWKGKSMSRTLDTYLADLKAQLAGTDPATIQDALADAEDHLRSALEQGLRDKPGANEEEVMAGILEHYGTAAEVAKAYREIEVRLTPPFARQAVREERSPLMRFFGVVGEPQAYGALLYMLIALVTGIVYFTWAVTGVSLSLGLMVLVIGLPFFGLFMFSIKGLALVEGRLVEALLGVRMPRRQVPFHSTKGIWGKFKALVRERRTWTTLAYLVLQLPLGIIYFTLFITLLVYALNLIALPIVQYVLDQGLIVIGSSHIRLPVWSMPFLMLAGILDLVVLLHLARLVGRMHGGLAKSLLVQR